MKPPLVGVLPPPKKYPCVLQINLCLTVWGLYSVIFIVANYFQEKYCIRKLTVLQVLKNASWMAQSNQHGHFSTLPIFGSLPLLKGLKKLYNRGEAILP